MQSIKLLNVGEEKPLLKRDAEETAELTLELVTRDPLFDQAPHLFGVLLGARQLGFLAKSYIVNIVVFLSGLLVVDRLGLGLRAVWAALFSFQILRFGVFTGRAWALRLLGRD